MKTENPKVRDDLVWPNIQADLIMASQEVRDALASLSVARGLMRVCQPKVLSISLAIDLVILKADLKIEQVLVLAVLVNLAVADELIIQTADAQKAVNIMVLPSAAAKAEEVVALAEVVAMAEGIKL